MQLQGVNRQVNEEIELVSDMDNLGVEEQWNFPIDCRGDCEDFALEKRERLVAIGWPRSALTISIAFHEVQYRYSRRERTDGLWTRFRQ